MLRGRGLCDELITRPGEFYRMRCVVMCDIETSRIRGPRPTTACRTKNKQSRRGIKQATHIDLLPRLGMGGVTPLLPLYAFMASTGHLFLAFTAHTQTHTHTHIRMHKSADNETSMSKIWVKKHVLSFYYTHTHIHTRTHKFAVCLQ